MKDPEKQDEYYVRLSGKANIPEPLEIGKNYRLVTEGTVTGLTEADLNDGRHVIYYKYAPVTMETIDDKGHAIRAKDTRSLSQLWRGRVWKHWNSKTGAGLTSEDYYERLMMNMIQQADEICEMYGEARQVI